MEALWERLILSSGAHSQADHPEPEQAQALGLVMRTEDRVQ